MNKRLFCIEDCVSYERTIPEIFDRIGASDIFTAYDRILLKPNLVTASAFPVTTSPACCREVIKYIQCCSHAHIIIAEGCGDASYETGQVFTHLGYDRLAAEFDIELVDLNTARLVKVTKPENTIFPSMFLPELVFETYLFSLPVLKAHSLAGITGTLKNMMGLAPPQYYSGGGAWKKAAFHREIQQAIVELNRFRTPDLTLLDASVGLSEYHLGGPVCTPPAGKLIVSDDPQQADQCAAGLLGLNPADIYHLNRK